jgi:hypothetical protein
MQKQVTNSGRKQIIMNILGQEEDAVCDFRTCYHTA